MSTELIDLVNDFILKDIKQENVFVLGFMLRKAIIAFLFKPSCNKYWH